MRAFHGAKQGTASAEQNRAPGDGPVVAAANMHDGLAEDAAKLANGSRNVPIHPAQVPSEGSDGQETEGDGSVRDPTGIGRGT